MAIGNALSIRPATDADIPDLLALYRHLVREDLPLSEEKATAIFRQFQSMGASEILLAYSGEILVASCVLIIVPNLTRGGMPYALIENVVTHGDHRGRGIGQQLLDHAVDKAWQMNCYKVMLLTGSKHPKIVAFYEKCGFEASKTGFQIRRLPIRDDTV